MTTLAEEIETPAPAAAPPQDGPPPAAPGRGDLLAAYAEESATELRKAAEYNESRRRLADRMTAEGACTASIRHEIAERSLDIASYFATLAAITAGLPPCRCHAGPDGTSAP